MDKKPGHEMSDMDLMLYSDGERLELPEWAKDKADARAKLKSLEQVGEVLRTTIELEQDDSFKEGVPTDDMWSTISARIEQSEDRSLPMEHSLSASQTSEHAPLSGIRKWFSGWQAHFVTGALAAGAVFLLTRSKRAHESDGIESPKLAVKAEPNNAAVSESGAKIMPVGFQAESQPPEVEHLEVFDGEGMVLTIPGENGDTAVIWVSNDKDVEGPL